MSFAPGKLSLCAASSGPYFSSVVTISLKRLSFVKVLKSICPPERSTELDVDRMKITSIYL
jgi:hypothetical protein